VDQDRLELVNLATELPVELQLASAQLRTGASTAQKGAARERTIDVGSDSEAQRKLKAIGYATDSE
jgi:hypothetical protein